MFGLLLIKMIQSKIKSINFNRKKIFIFVFSLNLISTLSVKQSQFGYQRRPAKDDFM